MDANLKGIAIEHPAQHREEHGQTCRSNQKDSSCALGSSRLAMIAAEVVVRLGLLPAVLTSSSHQLLSLL
jgi:hypothetical protein